MTETNTETELMTASVLTKMLKEMEEQHKKLIGDIQQHEQKVTIYNQEQQAIKNQMVTDTVELQGKIKLLQDQIKMLSGKVPPSTNGDKQS